MSSAHTLIKAVGGPMKNTTRISKFTMMFLTIALTVSCSKGFKSESTSSSNNTQCSTCGTGTGGDDPLQPIDFKGIAQGYNNGRLVVEIDKVNQALIMKLPIPPIPLLILPLVKQELPELKGVELITVKEADGTKVLAVKVPLKYLIKGANFLPTVSLPNGDPLPGFPAGEGAGFGVAFPGKPDYKIHIFIGVNAAAAFVETPKLDIPFEYVEDVMDEPQTHKVGSIGIIGTKDPYAGGFYIAAQLPAELAVFIDNHIKW